MRRPQPRPTTRGLARLGASAAVGLAVLVGGAGGALAHVGVQPGSSPLVAGVASPVVLTFDHGCDGSPTTKLALKVPDGVDSVSAQPASGWTSTTGTVDGVEQVTLAADPAIPSGVEVSLQLTVVPSAASAGKALVFPVVQTCEKGETAWVQLPRDGQTTDDLDHPASVLTVQGTAGADTATSSDSKDTLGAIGLAAGVVGVGLAAAATVAARRRHREKV